MRKLIVLFLFFVVFPKQQSFAESLYYKPLNELTKTQQFAEKAYVVLTKLNYYEKGEKERINKDDLGKMLETKKFINYVMEYFSYSTPSIWKMKNGEKVVEFLEQLIDRLYEKVGDRVFFGESEFGKDLKEIKRINKILRRLYGEEDWKNWVKKEEDRIYKDPGKACNYRALKKAWKKFNLVKKRYKRAKEALFEKDLTFRGNAIRFRIEQQQKKPSKKAATRRG